MHRSPCPPTKRRRQSQSSDTAQTAVQTYPAPAHTPIDNYHTGTKRAIDTGAQQTRGTTHQSYAQSHVWQSIGCSTHLNIHHLLHTRQFLIGNAIQVHLDLRLRTRVHHHPPGDQRVAQCRPSEQQLVHPAGHWLAGVQSQLSIKPRKAFVRLVTAQITLSSRARQSLTPH